MWVSSLSSIDKVVDAVGIQDLITSVLNEVAGKIPVNVDQKDEQYYVHIVYFVVGYVFWYEVDKDVV